MSHPVSPGYPMCSEVCCASNHLPIGLEGRLVGKIFRTLIRYDDVGETRVSGKKILYGGAMTSERADTTDVVSYG